MASSGSKNNSRFSDDNTTLKIIHAIENNGGTSQRTLAKEVEIALGLTNAYLKRCIRKGWVKVTQAPTQRYFYYLTPKGFSEKARLTATYLSNSFDMFREARAQCDTILQHCHDSGLKNIALIGVSELAEVAILSSLNKVPVITAIVDPSSNLPSVAGISVVRKLSELPNVDGVIVTDMRTSQHTFEKVALIVPENEIFVPELLHVNRKIVGFRKNGANK